MAFVRRIKQRQSRLRGSGLSSMPSKAETTQQMMITALLNTAAYPLTYDTFHKTFHLTTTAACWSGRCVDPTGRADRPTK